MNPVSKFLIVAGLVLIALGLLHQFGGSFLKPGRLPGDIAVERENFRFYFPLATSLLVSGALTLLFWLLRARGK